MDLPKVIASFPTLAQGPVIFHDRALFIWLPSLPIYLFEE